MNVFSNDFAQRGQVSEFTVYQTEIKLCPMYISSSLFFFSTHEKVHGGNRCGTQYLELLFLRQKTEVDVSENICYNVNPLMLLTGLKASSVVPLPMRSRLSSLRRIANPGQTPTAPRIFSVQFLYCSIFLGICFKRTWDLF